MTDFRRYAIYYAPPEGPLAETAARWLGRDAWGAPVAPILPAALHAHVAQPARYGFHGTIKAPFRLAEGCDAAGLIAELDAFAAGVAPVALPGLRLVRMDGCLALLPEGDVAALNRLAAAVVSGFDPFRAPLTEAEIARRRPERLSPAEYAHLLRWGYPWVMEAFRFHLTLSGPLDAEAEAALRPLAEAAFGPLLGQPFAVADLCLFGEDAEGMFHAVHRSALSG
jgi:hypothetical protein